MLTRHNNNNNNTILRLEVQNLKQESRQPLLCPKLFVYSTNLRECRLHDCHNKSQSFAAPLYVNGHTKTEAQQNQALAFVHR